MAEKRCYGCMRIKNESPVCEHCGFNETAENAPHQLPMGTVLRGQYLVGKVLGQGGFGITYMGLDLKLETPIAIKEYYPRGMADRDCRRSLNVVESRESTAEVICRGRQRFLREAKALARLREVPEIVQVHNYFEENGTAYFIMEYVEGNDLRQYIKWYGGRLTVGETLSVLKPVMDALEEVHRKGLVHRDISPDNIMILPNGGAKLLDFGAVRDMGDDNSTEIILKYGFAPIEQYQRSSRLKPETDVYALCAVIYYCLTGSVPPEAPERMMANIPVDWNRIPGLTERQAMILEKGMAINPEDRVKSVEILRRENT